MIEFEVELDYTASPGRYKSSKKESEPQMDTDFTDYRK